MAQAVRRHTASLEAGFSLFELIVVLVMLTVILGAVSPVFIHSVRINRGDQAIRDLVAYMKFAQESAVTDGCEYRLYLNHDEGTYWLMYMSGRDGEDKLFKPVREQAMAGKRRLPDVVEMDRPRARDDRDRDAHFVAFYPNGSCDFARIRLEYGDHGRTIIRTEGSLGTFDISEREDD